MFQSIRTEAGSAELKKYIKQFWEVKSDENNQLFNLLLPVANNDIIIYFSNPVSYHFENGIKKAHRSIFQGPRSKSIGISQAGNIHIIGVTFKMFLSLPFSPLPLKDLKDSINEININFKLTKEIDLRNNQPEIEKKLLTIINKEKEPQHDEFDLMMGLLNSNKNISAYCQESGINIKKLERLYIKYTGMPPKQFMKIYRMQITNNKIINEEFDSLTDLSYEMGYFDQPHMGKDFNTIHSIKPKFFLNETFTMKSILKKNS